MANPWTLLQSFTTAGTYAWTAPDINSGNPYQVGYYIIGGGGSGGAALTLDRSYDSLVLAASGGASGRTANGVLAVTPGTAYSVIVGGGGTENTIRQSTQIFYAGGTPSLIPANGSRVNVSSGTRVANGSGSLPLPVRFSDGSPGESSSFNGIRASGGAGGNAAISAAAGSPGGQGSDASSPATIAAFPTAPYSGRQTAFATDPYAAGGSTYPLEAQNPFEPYTSFLIAGGAACILINLLRSTLYAQSAGTASYGSGSPGTAVNDNTNQIRTITGITPTAYGAGSGGVVVNGYARPSVRKTVITGAGASGGVFLYY